MSDVVSVRENEKNIEIQHALDKKAMQKQTLSLVIPYVGLTSIVVFFIVVTGGKFISMDNIGNLINQGFTLSLIAIGSAFVYAHGGMDFSIGSVAGVAQLVCGMLLLAGMPFWMAVVACILVCVLGASLTAGITLGLGIPVFVGSMCVRTSFAGILKTAVEESEIAINYRQYGFMNSTLMKGAIILVVVIIGWYLFNYTTIGKYNKALGGNPRTAQQAGVNRKKMVFIAYLLMGLCVGIASVFSFFRTGKVMATSGSGWEFNIMMAIILGGFPMAGGDRSRISSAIVGALTVTCLTNGLGLWGLDASLINLVQGVLFVAIIALSYDRSNGKLVN